METGLRATVKACEIHTEAALRRLRDSLSPGVEGGANKAVLLRMAIQKYLKILAVLVRSVEVLTGIPYMECCPKAEEWDWGEGRTMLNSLMYPQWTNEPVRETLRDFWGSGKRVDEGIEDWFT